MTLLAQSALAVLMIAGILFSVRAHIATYGTILTVGLLCWGVGFVPWIGFAIAQDMRFPNIGHLLWLTAAWLIFIGTLTRRGPHRQYIGTQLVLDMAFVCFAWLMLVWRAAIWRPGMNSFADINWLALAVIFSELTLFATAALLAGNLPSPTMITLAIGEGLLVLTDSVLLRAQGEPFEAFATWRLALAVLTGLVLAGSIAFHRPPKERPIGVSERHGRGSGALTMVLAIVPLLVYVPLMRGGQSDTGGLFLSVLLVASFAVREIYRARQSKTLLDELGHQALHDPLTQLANRRHLEEQLRYGGGAENRLHVLTLDVDKFKEVNRQLGHSTGDEVLVAVARVLTALPGVAAFRLGGDEFALVTTGEDDEAVALAEHLRATCAEALRAVPGVEPLAVTVSVGLADCSAVERAHDPLAVLNRSAQALRAAKDERNRVRVYSDEDGRVVARRARVEQRLRAAIAESTITFVYQPIVSLSDGAVIGFESLARWDDPELGRVSPAEFIPVGEQTGLIHDLGWQCLEQAATLQQVLRSNGITVGVSVNVSPVQLRRPGFVKRLLQLMADSGLPLAVIILEVTEGVFIDLDDTAVEVLHYLHKAGVGISIDDFGAGYSSLGYVTRLPATVLKVDRMLTARLNRPESRSIISALLSVAGAHGVHVVIEGVETEELATELSALGAEWAQGSLYSAGVPATDVLDLIGRLGLAARAINRDPHGDVRPELRPSDT